MTEADQKTTEPLLEELERLRRELADARRRHTSEAQRSRGPEETLSFCEPRRRSHGETNPRYWSFATGDSGTPDFKRLFEAALGLCLVLHSNVRSVAASAAYLQATLTRRSEIVGRHLFEVFPDSPDDPEADSIRNRRASMKRVQRHHVTGVMAVQRHDLRRPELEGVKRTGEA